AGLCDGTYKEQDGQPRHLCTHGRVLFRTRDLRNSLACCKRTFLQHDQHRTEHPFGHALRHQQKEKVGLPVDEYRAKPGKPARRDFFLIWPANSLTLAGFFYWSRLSLWLNVKIAIYSRHDSSGCRRQYFMKNQG